MRNTLYKQIRWNTFPRDFIVIQLGFALFGLAIATLIEANLGTSPWVMLSVALANIMGLTPGILTVVIGFGVLLVAMSLKEQIGWGTLANILFIGPWVDVFLWLLPSVENNWVLQLGMLVAAAVMMGLATGIYIGVNAGAGPRDSLMLAVSRTTGYSVRRARGTIELTVFVIAWLLDGPFGVGTIIFAFLIGPAVQWGFRLLNVQSGHSDKYFTESP